MRNTWIGFAVMWAGVAGCGPGGGLPPGTDMASDMSVTSDDMPIVDLDMAIPDDAQKIVTFTVFAMDYAQTYCTHLMSCGQLDAAQMSSCIERNLKHTGWSQDTEITKGRLEINELQCLAAIKTARCDNSDAARWGFRCRDFLYKPHQANGSTCLSFVECMSGVCQHAGSDAGAGGQPSGCPGTCAPPLATGAPCRITQDCAADSYCTAASGCQKRAALGASCAGTPCQIGLLCPTFPGTPPATCTTPPMQANLDEPCDPFQGASTMMPACASDLYCQIQYTGATASGGICKMKIDALGACDPKNESFFSFVDNQCVDGTRCYKTAAQVSETCQPFGSADSDCVTTGGTTSTCKEGLYCNAMKKCQPFFAYGQTCDVSAHCPGILPGQSTCIADNADAGAGTTCEVAKNFGVACAPGFEDSLCAPADNANTSYCAATTGGNGVCAPKCF